MNYLPPEYLHKMQHLLKAEFPAFLASYQSLRSYGLRVNTLKIELAKFRATVPFDLEPIPWTSEGFYYPEQERPGKHPFHAAGLYYIQEPSAMAVGQVLNPQPGEKVLDLCAAPGGKTTHLASKMQGQGLLVANEYIPSRAKILAENLERWGVPNALILNESPQKLAGIFPGCFDRILVDAPCSGEGMFRKEPEGCAEWSLDHVYMCASRQLDILYSAHAMLRPGGYMVYSTCTFSPEENEQVIAKLLDTFADLELLPSAQSSYFSPGRADWCSNDSQPGIPKTMRLWPHLLRGEGHFIALLHKKGESPVSQIGTNIRSSEAPRASIALWQDFQSSYLHEFPFKGTFCQFAEHLYLTPTGLPDLKGIKVTRPGWHLGMVKKNRFEPSHALALGLKSQQARHVITLPSQGQSVLNYLRGEALDINGEKGWNLVTVDDFPLGWGKHDGTTLKNHYPKGLRWH